MALVLTKGLSNCMSTVSSKSKGAEFTYLEFTLQLKNYQRIQNQIKISQVFEERPGKNVLFYINVVQCQRCQNRCSFFACLNGFFVMSVISPMVLDYANSD